MSELDDRHVGRTYRPFPRKPPDLFRRQVMIRIIEEVVYSGVIWIALMRPSIDPLRHVRMTGGWLCLAYLTAVAAYAGIMTRIECADLRFAWFSLHRKIPDWVLWTFWPALVAVWVVPAFAPFAYLSIALAAYRGFWFPRHCVGYRVITGIDLIIRGIAGFTLI
ncbi:hypothetical protein JXA80_07550 [bacterium]|nr:hypothetical protein [candidate division CSSED10-310 bacterium]